MGGDDSIVQTDKATGRHQPAIYLRQVAIASKPRFRFEPFQARQSCALRN
jgi:hypothetical protein